MAAAHRISAAALLCGMLAALLGHLTGHGAGRVVVAGLLAWVLTSALGFLVVALRAMRAGDEGALGGQGPRDPAR
jgi:hypothetical protein